MAQALLITKRNSIYSENILPESALLNNGSTLQILSGGGTGSTVEFTTAQHFVGTHCIKSFNNTNDTPLVFGIISPTIQKTIEKTGTHMFSIELMQEQNPNNYFPHKLTVGISVNGVFGSKTLEITLPTFDANDISLLAKKWYTFAFPFIFNAGEIVDFNFKHETDPTTTSGTSTLYIDAPQLEFDDRLLNGIPSMYSKPTA